MEQQIAQRLNDLFIDIKIAQDNLAQEGQPKANAVEIEQQKTARKLLTVEKQAIRERDLNQKMEINFLLSVSEQIDEEVELRMQPFLEDTEHLYNKVIGIDEDLPELLDAASVKAASISKAEPIASNISWLYNDLLKLVNQPKYQRTNSKGKVILVDSMRAGLGFFGIENLSMIVTSLAFKRWLPQITDPFPDIKHRIWEEALGTAISCKQIASISNINPQHAFCLGMLQALGKIVVTRLYFRIFEQVQQEALNETEKKRQHEEHKALQRVSPSGNFLVGLVNQYAFDASTRLVKHMNLQRIPILHAVLELNSDAPPQELSAMAKLLKQGQTYAQYRMLKRHKLITLEQSKELIRSAQMPKGSLELLKLTDLRSLGLTAEVQD
jgi:hypothetical protein